MPWVLNVSRHTTKEFEGFTPTVLHSRGNHLESLSFGASCLIKESNIFNLCCICSWIGESREAGIWEQPEGQWCRVHFLRSWHQ